LICTDPHLQIQKLLQAYLWRWGIEVNFKEQKSILGCGKAQVRNEKSCQNVPAFHTSIYAMILLASIKQNLQELPRPKWYKKNDSVYHTTGDILNQFRAVKWANSMAIDFNDFVKLEQLQQSRKISANPSISAMIYCRN
jgi:hypothetical protein